MSQPIAVNLFRPVETLKCPKLKFQEVPSITVPSSAKHVLATGHATRSSPLCEMLLTVRLCSGNAKYGVGGNAEPEVWLQWMRNELSREQSSVVPNGKGMLTLPQLFLQFGLRWVAACAAQRIAATSSSSSSSRGCCFNGCTAMTLFFRFLRSYLKMLYIEIPKIFVKSHVGYVADMVKIVFIKVWTTLLQELTFRMELHPQFYHVMNHKINSHTIS